MAVFRSNIGGEMKGSIGGLTFSKNASGGIARFKSKNINRNTVKQSSNRNRFTQANSIWHTYTDVEKQIFKSYDPAFTGINNAIFQNNFRLIFGNTNRNVQGFSFRINNGSVAYTVLPDFNLFFSYSNSIVNSFNLNRQKIDNFSFFSNDSNTINSIRINLVNLLPVSNSNLNFFRSTAGLPTAFILYVRPLLAQRFSNNSGNFSPIFSYILKNRSATSSEIATFFSIRVPNSVWASRFVNQIYIGKEFEFKVLIFDSAFNHFWLDSFFYTFL